MADPQEIETAIRRARNQEAFIQDLLIDALGWDIDPRADDVEEIGFEWSVAELRAAGLEKCLIDGTIRQIRPLMGNPWGIFLLEFRNPDVFLARCGMTGPLRNVLRGLVRSKRKRPTLASFGNENLLFICNHDYRHYRFVHFRTTDKKSGTAPLAAFGWGPGDPIRMLCEYNLNALEWPETARDAQGWIEAWSQAFDVEKVTRRFYEDYAAVFAQVETLIGEHFSPAPTVLQGNELRMFTQMLFNRLMFLRFMECKGWLTFGGEKHYLRALYAAHGSPHTPCAKTGTRRVPTKNKKSFYRGRLCPLFFEGLAVEGKQQSEAYGQVPYLDGGLFERTDLDRRVTDLPDEVFAGILADEHAGGLFYRYNFTVEESTPLDVEVAVDPEMLGKVFEELVTGRHETGAYYTPRPVVSFMCREALKGYLSDKLNVVGTCRVPSETDPARGACRLQSAITVLVDRHDARNLRETQARDILAALDELKAIDPACGSGAYLMGLLQEMIALYRLLYREKLANETRTLYDLKLRIISRNLYGVDVDPLATNIAKLRLWLSLAVEADQPLPLPKLDFKIETGDSLLGLRAGKQGGFDIVLANPPYVRQEMLRPVKPRLKKRFPEVFAATADLYVYFYARALRLLRNGGMLVFIAPNRFFRSAYGRKLRQCFSRTSHLRKIIDFGDCPIFAAAAYPSIVSARKLPPAVVDQANEVSVYTWGAKDDLTVINAIVESAGGRLSQASLADDGWHLDGGAVRCLINKIKAAGKPLCQAGGTPIHRGLLTGFNEAFIIDKETREALIGEDARSAEILRPFLRGRDVKRWSVEWAERYLIWTYLGVDMKCYPAIMRRLRPHRDRLAARQDRGNHWWELRACAYYEDFRQPKIVYPDIFQRQSFAYDPDEHLMVNTLYFMPRANVGLLGILNSSLMEVYYARVSNQIRGGYRRSFTRHVSGLPIVSPTAALREKVQRLLKAVREDGRDSPRAAEIERDVNDLVFDLYSLTRAERKLIAELLP